MPLAQPFSAPPNTPAPTAAQTRLASLTAHLNPKTAMSSPPKSAFDAVPMAPTDPLFGLMASYKADTHEKKVDLGVGAYRDDNAKPWVLPVVKKVCTHPAELTGELRSPPASSRCSIESSSEHRAGMN